MVSIPSRSATFFTEAVTMPIIGDSSLSAFQAPNTPSIQPAPKLKEATHRDDAQTSNETSLILLGKNSGPYGKKKQCGSDCGDKSLFPRARDDWFEGFSEGFLHDEPLSNALRTSSPPPPLFSDDDREFEPLSAYISQVSHTEARSSHSPQLYPAQTVHSGNGKAVSSAGATVDAGSGGANEPSKATKRRNRNTKREYSKRMQKM